MIPYLTLDTYTTQYTNCSAWRENCTNRKIGKTLGFELLVINFCVKLWMLTGLLSKCIVFSQHPKNYSWFSSIWAPAMHGVPAFQHFRRNIQTGAWCIVFTSAGSWPGFCGSEVMVATLKDHWNSASSCEGKTT